MKEQEDGENCMRRRFMRYSSPIIIKIIKGRMRWVGHVECMRQIRTGMFKPLVLY
jgi:hypothetical protein